MIIAAVVALITLVVATTSYRLFKLNRMQTAKIAGLQSQLSILCAGAVGTDDRIHQFEKTLSTLQERHNTLSLGTTSSPQSYEHAIRLARKGVAIEQLIDNCNLSDEEAHLISRLHGSEDQQGLH
ncbi:MAG: hypothetical protein COA83_02840 [Methylophaga sp.]|nr:MAG: hypothetical protein COA83_02840 [Methylophaga sp.]